MCLLSWFPAATISGYWLWRQKFSNLFVAVRSIWSINWIHNDCHIQGWCLHSVFEICSTHNSSLLVYFFLHAELYLYVNPEWEFGSVFALGVQDVSSRILDHSWPYQEGFEADICYTIANLSYRYCTYCLTHIFLKLPTLIINQSI